MIPVFQNITTGKYSNCLQASIASIFDLEIWDVPEFAKYFGEPDELWFKKLTEFCLTEYVYPLTIRPFTMDAGLPPALHGYHLMSVQTTRGVLHSVVGYQGSMVHDPYPGGSVITGIEDFMIFVSLMGGRG